MEIVALQNFELNHSSLATTPRPDLDYHAAIEPVEVDPVDDYLAWASQPDIHLPAHTIGAES